MDLLCLFGTVVRGHILVEVLVKHSPNATPLIVIGHSGHVEIPAGPVKRA